MRRRCGRRAVRDGDCWVINGTKQFITHGRTGDLIVVMAVTNSAQGQPRHLRVHRRARHAGIPRRQEGRQARHARERDERSDLRELPRAAVAVARARKGRDSSTRCRCSTRAASASRRSPSASRRARTKRRGATRSSASSSASRSALPEHPRQAGGQRDAHRGGASVDVSRRGDEGRGQAHDARSGDGQAVLERDRRARGRGRRADSRRLRLRQGLSGREIFPRRQAHDDRRRHERDPAARHRAATAAAD